MNFYRVKSKIIYRRYRLIKRIIWTYKYVDYKNFEGNILLLISIISAYTYMIYGKYSQLAELNDFYKSMCLKEMHKRLMTETDTFS